MYTRRVAPFDGQRPNSADGRLTHVGDEYVLGSATSPFEGTGPNAPIFGERWGEMFTPDTSPLGSGPQNIGVRPIRGQSIL